VRWGSQRGQSVQRIQVETAGGEIREYYDQTGIEKAIWSNIHHKRFYLAEEAPICQPPLWREFGYCAQTAAGRAVNGTYEFPINTDLATRELLEEVTHLWEMIPANSVLSVITGKEWSTYWRRAQEKTFSLESRLHFGHRLASASLPLLSHLHATRCLIALWHGFGYKRWSWGLLVMLEKIKGCSVVTKLRSILLMEADFNAVNKIIYGQQMLQNVRKYSCMPDEICSEKNQTANNGTLTKVLFYDIVRQSIRSAGISSVDADNCFDRVAHAVALLIFQAFGVSEVTCGAMLKTIQEMQFFLRTAFGDSKTVAGMQIKIKTQGLCQGNGAAPAGWAVVSIVILHVHSKQGHRATFRCPISGTSSKLAAILYVDDMDVIHLQLDEDKSVEETHKQLQASVLSWGNLLIATGGSLKPEKCFYHIISFDWRPDGIWRYANNKDREDLQIMVPQPDDTFAAIAHLGVSEVSQTLGSMSVPSSNRTLALMRVKEKAQGWIDTAKNTKLSQRHLWFLVDRQFWSKVGFGVGTILASFEELTTCLHRQ
jgi:hypothetical protein